MNELRDILHQRHHDMAASLRHAPEFDETAAVRSVRSHRRGRAIVMGSSSLATVTVLAAGAWLLLTPGQPDVAPAITPSPSVSASPTPEASASATPSPEPVSYEGRNPGMSDGEAYYRAEHPATGEVWLDEPVAVDAPDGLQGDAAWWEVGTRAGATILAGGSFGGFIMVEVAADGEMSEVVSPFPHDPAASEGWTDLAAADTYYDSLALPATWTSADGIELDLRDHANYAYGMGTDQLNLLCDGCTELDVERVAAFGSSHAVRVVDSGSGTVTEDDGATSWAVASGGRVVAVAYALELPFGPLMPLWADPVGTQAALRAVAEYDEYGFVSNDVPVYVELQDRFCGPDLDWAALGIDEDPADWVETTLYGDLAVHRATADNPLTGPYYEGLGEYYPARVEGVSLDEYASAPAIVGAPAADGSGWWIEIRQDYSVRLGC
ncbi:hypothetical protein QQX09_06875 [Demequina sp. SYSU T00192]|uniref:Uncharacterized protein n=1 Tax=Demequina litoralis TaxID=3051660 RepID=A0ABT8G8V2_9MICO|nr:hypothetical protein [Demequina sp. SYSU T00192]MDN4475573.1 hypothetical protein [Demequina sp. SYSU T00192]